MQNSVNHRILERKLRFWAILKPCLVEYHKEKSNLFILLFYKRKTIWIWGLSWIQKRQTFLKTRPFKYIQMHDLPKFNAATSVAICSLWTIFFKHFSALGHSKFGWLNISILNYINILLVKLLWNSDLSSSKTTRWI